MLSEAADLTDRAISRIGPAGLATVCLALSQTPLEAQPVRDLSIEQIASAPFPSGLTASPRDGTVAWIYNERGARNIWIAAHAAGAYSSRRLTNYTGDDGVDIVDLTWSGDGKLLFFTRGGDGRGLVAVNPMSLSSGPKAGEIWSVGIDGGAPVRIADGQSPTPSPDGERMAFLWQGHPWVSSTNKSGAPAELFSDPGRVESLTWSPDGSRLAFVSVRPQHSLLGIYDFPTKSIQWIAPGMDQVGDPVWSPDGRRIAFQRHFSGNDTSYASKREGDPWEIWIADAQTGAGKCLWRARPGVGSRFRELFNSPKSLFWTSDGRLVFPSEVSEWVRLYTIPAGGGEPSLLTPGQSEIFGAVLSPDGTRIIYSSNQGDLDRRHIWETVLASRESRQLTMGNGVEDFPVITVDNRVLALRGEARSPMRPVAVEAKSMRDLAPAAIPPDFPGSDLVEPQLVTFEAADGAIIHGQIFIPRGLKAKAPALLFFHGGPTNRQAFASWDPFEAHAHLYEANQYLANHGYVVLSVNYRGGSGYGFEYRQPPAFGAGGAAEISDIVGAAKYLVSRSEVDPKRVGVWGGSYGGRMASLAMASAPQFFAAGVDYAGVHDFTKMPGFTAANPVAAQLAFESSALARVDTWRAPVLLIHADADYAVPLQQSMELAAALRQRDIPVESLVIPNEVHFLLRHDSWNRIFTATRGFFDQKLGGRP
jgi:dipeptidyl aminopeptidase/acylaminoacyl peptidase